MNIPWLILANKHKGNREVVPKSKSELLSTERKYHCTVRRITQKSQIVQRLGGRLSNQCTVRRITQKSQIVQRYQINFPNTDLH